MRRLFNPLHFAFVSFQLFSHKVLRWLIPIFLFALFVSNLWLLGSSWFYDATIALQLAFYGIAALGFLAERENVTSKLLTVPLYFVTVNAAAVVAMYRILRGYSAVTWETTRR
jgi:hypothetical protein